MVLVLQGTLSYVFTNRVVCWDKKTCHVVLLQMRSMAVLAQAADVLRFMSWGFGCCEHSKLVACQ
jgi:hypothetical protein